MKKGVLLIIAFTAMLNSVSAAFYNSGFNFENVMSLSTFFLITLFLTFLALLHLVIFRRVFRRNDTVSIVISGLLSLSAVWGLTKLDLNIESILYGSLGDTLYIIAGLILLIIIFFLSFSKDSYTRKKKFKLWKLFLILGIALIGLSLTEILYESGAALLIGVVCIFISILIGIFSKKKETYSSPYSYRRGSSKGPSVFKRMKDYSDPRSMLARHQEKKAVRQEKRDARRTLRESKDKDWHDAGLKIGRSIGRTVYGTPEQQEKRQKRRDSRNFQLQEIERKRQEAFAEKAKEEKEERLRTLAKEGAERYRNLQEKQRREQERLEAERKADEIRRERNQMKIAREEEKRQRKLQNNQRKQEERRKFEEEYQKKWFGKR
jgi:hypothetical protein